MSGLVLASVVVLTNGFGTARIDTCGANVLSYVPTGMKDVLFRQTGPRKGSAWYNGGVPICWPWFGRNGDPGSRLHGFVWDREWTVVSVENGATGSRARFRLESAGEYRLDYEVTLGKTLALKLVMRNLGRERFVVTTGFHPYFLMSSPENVTVSTPKGEIRCFAGMDGGRPFGEGTYEVFDRGTGRRLSLGMSGNNKIVIWNLGLEEKMDGMLGEDWRHFVCVEPAVLPRMDGFYLHPDEERTLEMTCAVLEGGK